MTYEPIISPTRVKVLEGKILEGSIISSTVHPTPLHILYSCNNRTEPMRQKSKLQAQSPLPSPTCARGL